MAFYNYECPEHGIFQIEKKITDEELKYCPECGRAVRRIYNATVNLNFNGSYNNSKGER